jgi:glycosyltransferase involved in cell wall biosynthesis
MKVLHLISSGGPYGAESVLVNLAHALQQQGCVVVAGVFWNSLNPHLEVADSAQQRGIPVKIFPCNGRVDRSVIATIRQFIETEEIDLVHSHSTKTNVYAYVAARTLQVSLVGTYHNGSEAWKHNLKQRLSRALDIRVLRHFDEVVAVSDSIYHTLREEGFPKSRLHCVENGLDLTPFDCATPSLTNGDGCVGRQLVGYVGRLMAPKGPHDFLRAAQGLLSRFPDARFVLVGDGPARRELENLAKDLRIENSVRFTGQRNDMPGVYASLDIVVLPSFSEGLPMTLIEALAARRAVVATRVGGVPRIVVDESTGLLTEPRNTASLEHAISRLLGSPELCRQLGERGRRHVEQHFSSSQMATQYLALYRRVVKDEGTVNELRRTYEPARHDD